MWLLQKLKIRNYLNTISVIWPTLYLNTLNQISSQDDSESFEGIRYKPASYIKAGSKFLKDIIDAEDEEERDMSSEERIQRITQAQANIAKFMRQTARASF